MKGARVLSLSGTIVWAVILSLASCSTPANPTVVTTVIPTTSAPSASISPQPTAATTAPTPTTTAAPSTSTTVSPTTATMPPTTVPVVTTPTKKIIFSDDFNSETTGANPSKWTVVEPAGTDVLIDDTVYFGTSGKSAKVQDSSSTEAPGFSKVVGVQTGKFWYQISLRLAQTNQIIGGVYIADSTAPSGRFGIDNLGVSVAFWSDGYMKYNDNDNDLASWRNVQAYEANKWYTLKVLVDVANQKMTLYVDDALKLTDVRFRYPVTALDQIIVTGRVELPSTTVWIDNVLLTEGP